MICLAGEAGWARLSPAHVPGQPGAQSGAGDADRALPARACRRVAGAADHRGRSRRSARRRGNVLSALRSRGASFFAISRPPAASTPISCGMRSARWSPAGSSTSDGFSGLRALVWAARGRPAPARSPQQLRRPLDGGRRRPARASPAKRRSSSRRGRCFAATASCSDGCSPARRTPRPWRELARVYRRLEARGEIRSGRFVTGMSGEQFALPDAVERLREVRRIAADGGLVAISAADPLNLTGIVTAGERIRDRGPQPDRVSRRRAARRPSKAASCGRWRRSIPRIAADVSRALKARRVPALAVH